MNFVVNFSIHCFLAFLLFPESEEIVTCDTKWIRYVYMLTCGRPKRESDMSQTDYSKIPQNFEDAFKYFQQRDPYNPFLRNIEILSKALRKDNSESNQNPFLLLQQEPIRNSTNAEKLESSGSTLMQKLRPKIDHNNHSNNNMGIQGFPEQWIIEEMYDQKSNFNSRRGIDGLIENCCSTIPKNTCNMTHFVEACKKFCCYCL